MSYVYIKSEPGCYTVGHYDPNDKWHPDSDHPNESSAAERVNFLNGGRDEASAVGAMSIRDLFAAAALAGMLAHGAQARMTCSDDLEDAAAQAFRFADAMMERRKK